MNDLPALMRRNIRIALFFLSIGCLGMAIWPDWRPIFGGFLLGIVGGFLMSLHLAWKLTMIGNRTASGQRPGSLGFLPRAAIGVLAAFVSVRYLGFNLPATAVGLLTGPMVTLILGIAAIRRYTGGPGERGEKQ